jgi:PIN domain nuclease of toxin-antitoxin system
VARIVLDTHALVYALATPHKLGRAARAAIGRVESGRDEGWIPAAVVAEVVLLRELGRTDIGLAQVRTALARVPQLRFLAMDIEQLDQFAGLGMIRDPFDRLILAAARALEARLMTRDQALADSGLVEAVWR